MTSFEYTERLCSGGRVRLSSGWCTGRVREGSVLSWTDSTNTHKRHTSTRTLEVSLVFPR